MSTFPHCGQQMIAKIRKAIATKFSTDVLQAFDIFATQVSAGTLRFAQERTVLDSNLSEQYEAFKAHEVSLWQQKGCTKSPDQVVELDGNPSASICLIMHYPTFYKSTPKFFDSGNACVSKMMSKGLQPEVCFGFDLHWRFETSAGMATRRKCPASEYPPDIIDAHDEFSFMLLDKLLPPLVVLAGECVFRTYTERYNDIKLIDLPLGDKRCAKIGLHFTVNEDVEITRIVLACPHPQLLFKANTSEAPLQAAKMDAVLNTVLRLANLPEDTDYFTRFWQQCCSSRAQRSTTSRYEPLSMLYAIINQERTSQAALCAAELPRNLLDWAQNKYPNVDIDQIEQQGLSIAQAYVQENCNIINQSRLIKEARTAAASVHQPANPSTEVHS